MTCCAINRSGSEELTVLFKVWHEQNLNQMLKTFLSGFFFPGGRDHVRFLRFCHTLFVFPGFSSPTVEISLSIIPRLSPDDCLALPYLIKGKVLLFCGLLQMQKNVIATWHLTQ